MIETAYEGMPEESQAQFYRSGAGAEVDLVLTLPGGERWAVEVKRSLAPKVERGFYHACEDTEPVRRILVYPGKERFQLANGIEAMPVQAFGGELLALCG